MNTNHKNNDDGILILSGDDVLSLLTGRELEIMRAVQRAYEAHARGSTSLPHSTFLRFPAGPSNRIIALPAFLGDDFQTAGIKWISSFPGNRDAGLDRASAVLILNSTLTGRPQALIEGSIISAKRTAASAALAARWLHRGNDDSWVGLIGCGLINLEIVRFLLADRPKRTRFRVFDTQRDRAFQFKDKAETQFPNIEIVIADAVDSVLEQTSLVSFATTATEPHIKEFSICRPGVTVLHISLRDLAPEVILSCQNVVDDIDHVCRAQTSVHLAELQAGSRDFIRWTLAEILARSSAGPAPNDTVIFSPFGLGILDMAVGKLVCDSAAAEGRGTIFASFLPNSWTGVREPVQLSNDALPHPSFR